MADVLIVGASKGIGLETVRQALACGHSVRAFARSAGSIGLTMPALHKITGDARDSNTVNAALSGVDVVVQTLGIGLRELLQPVNLFSQATSVLVEAMKSQGLKRLISVTGFGAGDSAANISPLQRIPFQLVFGRAYRDKDLQERLIKASPLNWTIVRPGVLTGGKRKGHYKILCDPVQWRNGTISRADVADFLVEAATVDTWLRLAVQLGG